MMACVANDSVFLTGKATEGVDVRLIYDGFGCLTTLPYHYERFLREKAFNARFLIHFVRF